MHVACATLLLVGCGRVRFEPRGADAAVDAAANPSLCGIPGGQWALSAPVQLTDVNDLLIAAGDDMTQDRSEFDPVFSSTGLELYVTSDQTGTWDVWIAKRAALDAPFTTVVRSAISSDAIEFGYQPVLAADAAVICANFGNTPDLDYYYGVDLATGPTWTKSSLSTPASDLDARLTADGLDIYFVRDSDIYTASRTSVATDFGAPRPVAELNTEIADSSPVPVGDLEMVFARTAEEDLDDLYLTSRATASEPFGPALRLDELRSDRFDGEPTVHVSPNGCEIVFVSNRAGSFNLYRSTVSRR